MITDDATIDNLLLSVRAERRLTDAGVKTVGELRAVDLAKVGLGSKMHRRAIAKALEEWDETGAAEFAATVDAGTRATEERRKHGDAYVLARGHVLALPLADRAKLFRELSLCGCAIVSDVVRKAPPGSLIGAGVGALLGAFLWTPSHLCASCQSGYHQGHLHGPACVCQDPAHKK